MKTHLRSMAALALLSWAQCAPAEVFKLKIDFSTDGPFTPDPSIFATGMIETTGDTGVFNLQSGISRVSTSGSASRDFIFGGPFALSTGDFSSLQLTLLDGVVQDFHLNTKDFNVPLQALGDGPVEAYRANFSVSGIYDGSYNTSMQIFNESIDSSSANGFSILTAVPEPSTWILNLTGLSLGGTIFRRRKTAMQQLVTR